MARVQPVFKPLLKPHLEDMEKKVAPGMFILTWASMNIDGYLHRFKQVGNCCNALQFPPTHTSTQPSCSDVSGYLQHIAVAVRCSVAKCVATFSS
jgi:hypothetical protein